MALRGSAARAAPVSITLAWAVIAGLAVTGAARAAGLGVVVAGRMVLGSGLQQTLHTTVQTRLMDAPPGERLYVVVVPGRTPGAARAIVDLSADRRPGARALQEIGAHNAMLDMATSHSAMAPASARVTTGGIMDALAMATRRLDQDALIYLVGPLGRLPPPTAAMMSRIRPGATVRLLSNGDESTASPDQRANISAWQETLREAGLAPWHYGGGSL